MENRLNGRRSLIRPVDHNNKYDEDCNESNVLGDFGNPLINSAVDQNGIMNDSHKMTRQNPESIDFPSSMNIIDRSSNSMMSFDLALSQQNTESDNALALILQEEEYSTPSFSPSQSNRPNLNNTQASNFITTLDYSVIVSDEEYAAHLQAEENQKQQQKKNQRRIPDSSRNQNHQSNRTFNSLLRAPTIPHPRSTASSIATATSNNQELNNNRHMEIGNFDGDFGPEHYLELLELDESFQKKKALTEDQINRLPTEKFRRQLNSTSEENKCSICMEDFKSDEVLRRLPCLHRYHKNCIDPWFKTNNICPICRTETFQ